MSVTDMSFSAALQRLADIRRELGDVADPDVVDQLEHEAGTLADHCRALLRRPRPLRARPVQSVSTDDDLAGPTAPADRRDAGRGAGSPAERAPDTGRNSPDTEATTALPAGAEDRTEQLRDRDETDPADDGGRTVVLPGGTRTEDARTEDARTEDAPTETVSAVRNVTSGRDGSEESPTTVLQPPR